MPAAPGTFHERLTARSALARPQDPDLSEPRSEAGLCVAFGKDMRVCEPPALYPRPPTLCSLPAYCGCGCAFIITDRPPRVAMCHYNSVSRIPAPTTADGATPLAAAPTLAAGKGLSSIREQGSYSESREDTLQGLRPRS
jgi:hypothetical protein